MIRADDPRRPDGDDRQRTGPALHSYIGEGDSTQPRAGQLTTAMACTLHRRPRCCTPPRWTLDRTRPPDEHDSSTPPAPYIAI